ncbi:Anti-sigma F factor antagonist [bioreactor metagenome]|uniref:Anti-sigma F factor antagonist n=1 Tax=bioreactor metagenome TaxID=1076179 RepID=A0A644YTU1_9ZZZZ
MPVTCTSRDRLLTVAISGEVDHHGAKAIMLELDRQINQCLPKNLTLDLSGVTFMDSSGIAVLLRAWRKMGELEGSVSVLGTPPQAAKVLRTAGVSRFVRFEK